MTHDDYSAEYPAWLKMTIAAGVFVLAFFLALGITSCQTDKGPGPDRPDDPPTTADPQKPETPSKPETPDETFVREFDACWAAYKACLKSKPDSVCFPVQEKCGIAAYRKLKKARGQK